MTAERSVVLALAIPNPPHIDTVQRCLTSYCESNGLDTIVKVEGTAISNHGHTSLDIPPLLVEAYRCAEYVRTERCASMGLGVALGTISLGMRNVLQQRDERQYFEGVAGVCTSPRGLVCWDIHLPPIFGEFREPIMRNGIPTASRLCSLYGRDDDSLLCAIGAQAMFALWGTEIPLDTGGRCLVH